MIKLATGLNVFQQDPSLHERILLLVSLLNSFHREGLQNFAVTSLCSNNIKENLFLKHGLVSRTYSKNPPIMASIFVSKSKFFMSMSIPPQAEPSINRLMVRDRNAKESWALLEDLALYDNESWNDPRDFARLVKAISLPQDVRSTSDRKILKKLLLSMRPYVPTNRKVLEVLAHAQMYNSILDKYVESLELDKNRFAFIQGEMPKRMEDPRLFTLPCRLEDSKPFDTLADLRSYMNIIPLYLFKKLNIGLLEETDHVFGLAKVLSCWDWSVFEVKEIDLGEEGAPYWTTLGKKESYKPRPSSDGVGAKTPYYARKELTNYHLPGEWEIARDDEINPFKDVLVFRRMDKPPKSGDGAWHAKIRIIDLDGEELIKTFQSIPTFKKNSEKKNPREIINFDHFHDT
nr:MAK10-like protein [Tanacetum cinerariifolium]